MRDFDLIVIGSGAGGLCAALTASLAGLKVVVLEHSAKIGGTSARSSGTVWIPNNFYLRAEGVVDDHEKATQYLDGLVKDPDAKAQWQTFLQAGPQMLQEIVAAKGAEFTPLMKAVDYRFEFEGAATGGRAMEPVVFKGATLGEDFKRLAEPLRELMVFGAMMVTRKEAFTLLKADKSFAALGLAIKLVGQYFIDRLRWKRGTRLVLGNALVARLLKALQERGVEVWTQVTTLELGKTDGKISHVIVEKRGEKLRLNTRSGVILAGGGFPANDKMREKYLPEPVAKYTPAAESCDGSTIQMGLAAGGVLGREGPYNAMWFPSSITTRADGSTVVYPHIVLDRAKPGLIAVGSSAKRFTNEAVSYHDFVRAMYAAQEKEGSIPAWLICNRGFIHKYGLGLIRPRTPVLRKYIKTGYLRTANTIGGLADEIGVDRKQLEETVLRFDEGARVGVDEEFGRGNSPYDHVNGDPEVTPNSCLGPVGKGPYFAVQVWPTPLGTSLGLKADQNARVVDDKGQPVPGLYVCGNDMQSVFGGEYPGSGGQIGPAMTFGWLAANHAASQARLNKNSTQQNGE